MTISDDGRCRGGTVFQRQFCFISRGYQSLRQQNEGLLKILLIQCVNGGFDDK
jgi:hypothetical protein